VSALPLPGHHSKAFLGCVVQKIRVVQRGSHPENGMIPSNNRIIILMWSVRIIRLRSLKRRHSCDGSHIQKPQRR
jgi:hypothetical protein